MCAGEDLGRNSAAVHLSQEKLKSSWIQDTGTQYSCLVSILPEKLY